jgi:hypothetical protein
MNKPSAYARKEVNSKGKMDEKSYEYFMHLVELKNIKYNKKDIVMEKHLEFKRSKTMEKLQSSLDLKRAYEKRKSK